MGASREDETILAMGQELHIDSVELVNIQAERGLDLEVNLVKAMLDN